MRLAIYAVDFALNGNMEQWYLIVIAIKAQNQIKKDAWINSF